MYKFATFIQHSTYQAPNINLIMSTVPWVQSSVAVFMGRVTCSYKIQV